MDITILSLKLKKLFNTGQSLQIPSRPKIIFVRLMSFSYDQI